MSEMNLFQIEGVVVRDAYAGANVAYVTVRQGEKQYWDVACFEDGPLDQVRNLRSGAAVKVRGHLGKRKLKGITDPQGRAKYEIQLVADRVKALAPLAPPPPEYQPQYAAYNQGAAIRAGAQPQGPWASAPNFPNPQWPNPAYPQMPPQVPMAQAGVEHPAQTDNDDGIPF